MSAFQRRETTSLHPIFWYPKVGNFVYVTNLCGIPSFGQMAELEIYDQLTDENSRNTHKGNLIGTCRVRGIDWSSGVLHDADRGVFRLYLFDINLKSGYSFGRDVKSFYMSRCGNFWPTFHRLKPLLGVPFQSMEDGYRRLLPLSSLSCKTGDLFGLWSTVSSWKDQHAIVFDTVVFYWFWG